MRFQLQCHRYCYIQFKQVHWTINFLSLGTQTVFLSPNPLNCDFLRKELRPLSFAPRARHLVDKNSIPQYRG
jgi:hypothetical protein